MRWEAIEAKLLLYPQNSSLRCAGTSDWYENSYPLPPNSLFSRKRESRGEGWGRHPDAGRRHQPLSPAGLRYKTIAADPMRRSIRADWHSLHPPNQIDPQRSTTQNPPSRALKSAPVKRPFTFRLAAGVRYRHPQPAA